MTETNESRPLTIEAVRAVAHRAAVLLAAGDLAVSLATDWPTELPGGRSCIHEAGHAVVGMALNKWPTSIIVYSAGGGITRFGEGPVETGLRSDSEKIDAFDRVLELGGDPRLDRTAMLTETAAILRTHWGAVQAIASRLLVQLIGGQSEALLTRSEILEVWELCSEFSNEKGESYVV